MAIIVDIDALCLALDCQPGDLLRWEPDDETAPEPAFPRVGGLSASASDQSA